MTQSSPRQLLQGAQLQIQAARFAYLQKASDQKLVERAIKKK